MRCRETAAFPFFPGGFAALGGVFLAALLGVLAPVSSTLGAQDAETSTPQAPALRIGIEVDHLSELGIPWLQQFRNLGPLRGSARLSVANEQLRFDDLKLRVADGDATLEITGTVGDAMRWRELDLAFTLEAPSARWLTTGASTRGTGALSLKGRVRSDGAALDFTELVLTTPSSQISGWITSSPDAEGHRLTGELEAKSLDFEEFRVPTTGTRATSDRAIPNATLPFAPSPALRADLTLTAERLFVHGFLLENSTTTWVADGSKTRLRSAGKHAGGLYEATLVRTPTDATIETSLQATLGDVSWEQATRQLGIDDYVNGGPTDAQIDVRGHGGTVHELLASLNGRFFMRTGESLILNPVLNDAGVDFVGRMVGLFTPAQDRATTTKVQCAAALLDIRNGVAHADNGLVVLTDKVSMAGTGQLDLRDESLSLAVALSAREGFNFSSASLAGSANLTGTLATPEVEVGTGAIATGAATVVGTVATGGLFILGQKLLSAAAQGPGSCVEALKSMAEDPTAAEPARSDDGAKGPARAITEGIGKGLRKLFGGQ